MSDDFQDIVKAAGDVARSAEVRLKLVALVQQMPPEDLELTAWLLTVAGARSRTRQFFDSNDLAEPTDTPLSNRWLGLLHDLVMEAPHSWLIPPDGHSRVINALSRAIHGAFDIPVTTEGPGEADSGS